ncbi:hypothetical protein SAMN05421638_0017 [Kaistella treverensis]|uniref:Uncharacterized protein n=1 Tax=Kaistella treverensis TaxID=631455 RepID=A0A1I3J831_9FLAO|nr:hypothetical protein [Kaistella treverensis]SFI56511.1 hypothetical protein SAMN05421638_0017 [Kaistella treverensis]
MKTLETFEKNSNKRLVGLLVGVAAILSFFAILQVTIGTGIDGQGFNWKLDDFVVIGGLLLGTALLIEFVLRKVKTRNMRILICTLVLLAFVLIWIDLAVGIFNIPGFSGS